MMYIKFKVPEEKTDEFNQYLDSLDVIVLSSYSKEDFFGDVSVMYACKIVKGELPEDLVNEKLKEKYSKYIMNKDKNGNDD